jgi:phage repressor protein C with HTH and peptisase S24 domain
MGHAAKPKAALTIGERLVQYAKAEKGWNKTQLAAKLEVSYETLRKWVTGEIAPNRNRTAQIADILGVTVEWITHGTLPSDGPELGEGVTVSERSGKPHIAGSIAVALMNVTPSMGHGIAFPQHEEVVTNMAVNEQWLRRNASFSAPENLSLVTGRGDSMAPTFHDGDVLMVDRGISDVKVDGVYALALNDELYIKRLQRRIDGTVLMISDNSNYPPQSITELQREHFRVMGRVVMAWNARRL